MNPIHMHDHLISVLSIFGTPVAHTTFLRFENFKPGEWYRPTGHFNLFYCEIQQKASIIHEPLVLAGICVICTWNMQGNRY